MALTTKVGSFTVPAATGNQATTGVGFQPKAMIFWGNGQASDAALGSAGTAGPVMSPFWGMAVSSTSRVVVTEGDDAVTANPTAADATKCVKWINGSTVKFAADLVSFDADGFTLNFTTGLAGSVVVNYLALGGADLTNVSLVSLTSGAATGNQATTGAGFQPDAILLLGADNGASNNGYVLGMGTSSTARGTVASAGNATTGGRIEKTDKVYCNVDGGSSIRCEADLVSLDSDGFTLNWTTANATTHTIYALCLKGGQYKVGSFLQKTSTGAQAYTGVGFTPGGLLTASAGLVAAAGLDTARLYTMTAAASGAAARGMTLYADGFTAQAALNRTHVYAAYADDTGPTLQAQADFTSFDADGFTFTYGTADATQREGVYLAIGSAAAAQVPYQPNYFLAPAGGY